MNLLLSEKTNFILVLKEGPLRLAWAPFVFIFFFYHVGLASFNLPKEKQNQLDQALISKNRISALKILSAALPKAEGSYSAFLEQYNNIAEMFFFDKTQQLFETASTLKAADLKAATQKMREAMALESDNILIIKELARQELAMNNCAAAKELALNAKQIHPYSEELLLLDGQSDVCANQLGTAITPKASSPFKKLTLQEFWIVLETEVAFKRGQLDRGLELVKQAVGGKRAVPEIFYWGWKLSLAKKQDGESYTQKYVNNCKSLSVRQIRELSLEPNLCKRVLEVENVLKKATVSE